MRRLAEHTAAHQTTEHRDPPTADVPRGESGNLLTEKLRELLGIDLRSLALFRIVLAALILVDLACRAPYIEANYTEAGVAPRDLFPRQTVFYLLFLGGSAWVQAIFFMLAAICAAMLLVGYRTTWATVFTWLLLGSIQTRNPWLLDGGDFFARLLLFWAIFLPLGARCSIDARHRPSRWHNRTAVLSVASIAIIAQFCFMYVNSGLLKAGPEWRTEGTALASFLASEHWTRPMGRLIAEYPMVLKWLTLWVVYFEIFGPLLLFSPMRTGPVRMAALAGFWLLQLGIGASIQFHMFPWYSTAGSLIFLPAWFWQRLPAGVLHRFEPRHAQPAAPPAGPNEALHRIGLIVRDCAVAGALVLVAWLNLDMAGILKQSERVTDFMRRAGLYQQWYMYHAALDYDTGPRLVGVLADESVVELLESPGSGDWEHVRRIHRTHRFRVFVNKLLEDDRTLGALKQSYLRWLCGQWNAGAPEEKKATTIELFAVMRAIREDGFGPRIHEEIAACRCPKRG